jgi:hypothetical protein
MSEQVTDISTSGDLRRFLCDCMLQVRDGGLDLGQANAIAGLAKELNSNMLGEVAVAKTRLNLEGRASNFGQVTTMGQLLIGK